MPLPAIIPAIGAIGAAATGVGSLIGAVRGGSSGSNSPSAQMSQAPVDYFASYGAQAAAANNPLTLAAQRYSSTLGTEAGYQGALANLLQSQGLSELTRSYRGSQQVRDMQAQEVGTMLSKGFDLGSQLGQNLMAVGMMSPTFLGQAGAAALQGDNRLANNLADTNLGIEALKQSAKTNIAQQYAKDVGDIFKTRATTEGNLALGQQKIRGQLALGDQNLVSSLTLNKAKTGADIARMKANVDATKDLRNNAMGIALAGQRFFA